MTADPLAEHRPHLLAVGYRLTGSRADAEDAVQDAWLRWDRLGDEGRAAVRDVRAWLATTVSRLCLDRVRSAPARRERYVGPWLPEPLVTTGPDDVFDAVAARQDVRMAALLVLEHLTPDQRVAFVLHDGAGVGFDDVAEVLGCTTTTARQHASRARRSVAAATAAGRLPDPVPAPEQRRVLDAFLAALAAGDVPAPVAVLHPDAELRTDGGGIVKAARRVVRGADRIARLLVALAQETGPELLAAVRPVTVNGEVGMLLPAPDQVGPPMVGVLTVADGRAVGVHVVMTPEKLRA
ncbi:RNA polymerase sigma factor SigJ [Actinomycetospora lemnae]|uniref:RNA polymerase sigma factor SigJ n=1 Tax=Actinomycetospora lemnae TaxID=3019891 RepID=A0ABT5SQ59_9PSEU|nr:RNA polymerase sigma factor SigJ [Actinomycetospora sp. DW7H6]MDD7964978.1 RNA polymerase sigma factor SigJ [Actinomycetospora sp. DW7H6]